MQRISAINCEEKVLTMNEEICEAFAKSFENFSNDTNYIREFLDYKTQIDEACEEDLNPINCKFFIDALNAAENANKPVPAPMSR